MPNYMKSEQAELVKSEQSELIKSEINGINKIRTV